MFLAKLKIGNDVTMTLCPYYKLPFFLSEACEGPGFFFRVSDDYNSCSSHSLDLVHVLNKITGY